MCCGIRGRMTHVGPSMMAAAAAASQCRLRPPCCCCCCGSALLRRQRCVGWRIWWRVHLAHRPGGVRVVSQDSPVRKTVVARSRIRRSLDQIALTHNLRRCKRPGVPSGPSQMPVPGDGDRRRNPKRNSEIRSFNNNNIAAYDRVQIAKTDPVIRHKFMGIGSPATRRGLQ
jgi:hypothetical protein